MTTSFRIQTLDPTFILSPVRSGRYEAPSEQIKSLHGFFLLTIVDHDNQSVTLSPVSVAALGEVSSTRGLSVRFPRFIRVREDKRPEQATTSRFLAQMYRDQQNRGKDTTGADDGDLVDMDVELEAQIEDESDADD